MQDLKIPAKDGFDISASYFAGSPGQPMVVIKSATAVPRQFYRRFATHCQSRGLGAITFDYRGIGDSRPSSLRGFHAKMTDWAYLDMAGVIDWAGDEIQPSKLLVVGHSVGGQLLGLLPNANRIDRVVGVCAQSGYWGVQGGSEPLKVRAIVSLLIPSLSRLLGYFPWSRFGAGEDLPQGVALQWASWCRRAGYLLDDPSLDLAGYEQFSAPILSYSVDDDNWGTAKAVDAMMRAYPVVQRRHISPRDYGVEKLGHMGAFKAGAESLWDEWLDWLQRA